MFLFKSVGGNWNVNVIISSGQLWKHWISHWECWSSHHENFWAFVGVSLNIAWFSWWVRPVFCWPQYADRWFSRWLGSESVFFKIQLELEHLRSEDTPTASWWLILGSHIGFQSEEDKVKVTNLKNLPKCYFFKLWNLYRRHTFWSCLIRCVNMKWIWRVLLKIQSGSLSRPEMLRKFLPLYNLPSSLYIYSLI